MSAIQDDPIGAYERYLRKGEFKQALRCLEYLISQHPKNIGLVDEIVDLAAYRLAQPELARKWLLRLVRMRTIWSDYALLGRMEALLDNITRARECLVMAKSLQKKQPEAPREKTNPAKIFREIEAIITYRENFKIHLAKLAGEGGRVPLSPPEKPKGNVSLKSPPKSKKKSLPPPRSSPAAPAAAISRINIPVCRVPVRVEPPPEEIIARLSNAAPLSFEDIRRCLDYQLLSLRGGFDELLFLGAMNNVDKYWYQIETVKKVLKRFHGRALLCDEVGLGKTIEAGMLIKEYLLRGMVKNVLILTPAPLVSQWQEEMEVKFGIPFLSTDAPDFAKDPAAFWREPFLVASMGTARTEKNTPLILEQFYDLVIVDEAHHLRNRTTKTWKLINQLQKKFILLLTATPVQNNLIELYNLITLLKPGQFKTERLFKQEYVAKGNLKKPVHREKLQELLREVMIRNTRSAIDLKLPKRFASTFRLEPSPLEDRIYQEVSTRLKGINLKKPLINILLREAGSSPFALKDSLLRLGGGNSLTDLIPLIDQLPEIAKGKALLEILKKNPSDKKIVFTQFRKTLSYITTLLEESGLPFATFSGDLTARGKDEAIGRFKAEVNILVSTESGGEGRNLQFCNCLINFDLPWNPMRIEQRIGRIHRIGQSREVFIFNLSVRGTIEDQILEILDSKINMFELVIGEIEPILGQLDEEKDFDDLVLDIWLRSADREDMGNQFAKLGDELVAAKQEYIAMRTLDQEIFGEDYEI